VLGLLVAETAAPGVSLMGDVIAVTVGISVVAHGVSASPLAGSYARWYSGATAVGGDLRESTPADGEVTRGARVPGQPGAAVDSTLVTGQRRVRL
jgi:hypothetical protein